MATHDELMTLVGTEIGVSEWEVIDQDRIDAFADATGDHQWIHVDRDRAAQGPFGGTIAHGYLTLSLLPALLADQELPVPTPRMGINYGLDRTRFITPVPVGEPRSSPDPTRRGDRGSRRRPDSSGRSPSNWRDPTSLR